MIIAVWRIWAFMLWYGCMFAVCTVVIAVALVLVVGAVVMGVLMPSRTVRGQLRSLAQNTRQLVAEIDALGGVMKRGGRPV
ncbi:MAG TPA: hypothetical protein VG294_00430 [Solirubrobacteraceae bacterium]|nr:hypothetical protein [Solirubrobacteraceae bacterium]